MTRKIVAGLPILSWLLLPALAAGWNGVDDPFHLELMDEVEASADLGLKALCFQQHPDGSWAASPSATALVVWTLMESHRKYTEEDGPWIRRALAYLAEQAGPDGVLGEPPDVGTTALVARVLKRSSDPEWRARGEKGERFLEDTGGDAPDGARHLSPQELARTFEAVDRGEAVDPHVQLLLVQSLAASGQETLRDGAGTDRSWRRELARKLIDRQTFEGTWPDESSEPTEAGRVEATAYAIQALDRLLEE